MRQILPDLWETEAEFPAPGLSTHAYLWQSAGAGNVLFYNTSHSHELDHMADLGGVARQYLSHQDEVGPSLRAIKERFGSTLHCHAAEADIAAEVTPVDTTFTERSLEPGGVEVLPTPGHTPGSVCFLVPSVGGGTYLFTGDSIFRGRNGAWRAGYIPGHSDRDALVESLTGLADLAPDVVISSAFAGDHGVHHLDGESWSDGIDQAISALTR